MDVYCLSSGVRLAEDVMAQHRKYGKNLEADFHRRRPQNDGDSSSVRSDIRICNATNVSSAATLVPFGYLHVSCRPLSMRAILYAHGRKVVHSHCVDHAPG